MKRTGARHCLHSVMGECLTHRSVHFHYSAIPRVRYIYEATISISIFQSPLFCPGLVFQFFKSSTGRARPIPSATVKYSVQEGILPPVRVTRPTYRVIKSWRRNRMQITPVRISPMIHCTIRNEAQVPGRNGPPWTCIDAVFSTDDGRPIDLGDETE